MEWSSTVSTSNENTERLTFKTKLFACVVLRYIKINSRLKERIEDRDETIKGLSRIVKNHNDEIKRLENELQNRNSWEWPSWGESTSESYSTLEKALEYLQDNAEVGVEYEILHVVRQLKYEMQRVLVSLNERDTPTLVDQNSNISDSTDTMFSMNTEEEESPSFAYENWYSWKVF